MNTRATATAAIALTALLTLSGCVNGMTDVGHRSDSSSTNAAAAADANMTDVMFTAMMIPHHEQAVEMADMVLAKEGIDDRVVTLAEDIKAAQGPEIDLMSGWLDDWGIDMGDGMGEMSGLDGMDGVDGMGHGDGMMSESDMDELNEASGDEASRLFLEQMIVHHEGAIDMAERELDSGQNADVLELAQAIMDAQTIEIALMRDILSSL
ncbi:uncharacterized protein (DUF305 family) [Salinibacterium amurskyense]|uniref:Uncharacterized protein (DUF305 family) n=1 Tax=Salinibacterium amurskyense TaxID=205941 RepID=A0A2M9D693_9MICO|nr:DUF305 domain-containing protein [Salinibacterium amurskyense]PJJ81235.1 uncharacterized protein (DUF305 family) [Salinibacterium amurskyense]RLQ83253.1 DUF305 domain-containing protein [Salinibacterium amurskyense]GHD81211.1 DUF305 domain-containing protein [Salinibacterium amurskyense]